MAFVQHAVAHSDAPENIIRIADLNETMQIKQQAFHYMHQLEGWCSQNKTSVLIDLVLKVKPEIIVEIGVWGGRSFIPMAYALKVNETGKIYGIDPWDSVFSVENTMEESNREFWSQVNHLDVMKGLIRKLNEFELEDQAILLKVSSEDAPPIHGIDILHIDGNHSEKCSFKDVTKWVPLVKSGGWIIFDGISWREKGIFTTRRAVKWLNENCIKIAQFDDDSAWGIWAKP